MSAGTLTHYTTKSSPAIVLNIDSLVQDCSNSIANALELLQSCTKPSICRILVFHRCPVQMGRNMLIGFKEWLCMSQHFVSILSIDLTVTIWQWQLNVTLYKDFMYSVPIMQIVWQCVSIGVTSPLHWAINIVTAKKYTTSPCTYIIIYNLYN